MCFVELQGCLISWCQCLTYSDALLHCMQGVLCVHDTAHNGPRRLHPADSLLHSGLHLFSLQWLLSLMQDTPLPFNSDGKANNSKKV